MPKRYIITSDIGGYPLYQGNSLKRAKTVFNEYKTSRQNGERFFNEPEFVDIGEWNAESKEYVELDSVFFPETSE